jgi:hypothetical protein
MAGLVPAIHVLLAAAKTWMPGTRPGMTSSRHLPNVIMSLRVSVTFLMSGAGPPL